MPKKIIGNDYTIKFHESASIGYQPIVGNYSVSEEVSRNHTGFAWEGSQGSPGGDSPQFEAFESGFGDRFLSFMSKSSDWGFCNDKIVQAQGGSDPLTPLYSSPKSFTTVNNKKSYDLSDTDAATPIIGKQNKFTKDGKLYTTLSPINDSGMIGICEYKRVYGTEEQNDRWEISDYIPIGTASFSTMDQDFHYCIVTGNSWNNYLTEMNNSNHNTGRGADLARIFDQSHIYWDVYEFGEEKYLAVNLLSEFQVDRADEEKGREGTWKNSAGSLESLSVGSGKQDQNWFIIMYRSGSTTGWRQETALTPKLLYDYCFEKDQNGARVNLRLLDQDPRYLDSDPRDHNPLTNFGNRERHFMGRHNMLRWYVRRFCGADRQIYDLDGDILGNTKDNRGTNQLINKAAWIHENLKIFNGQFVAGGSTQTINGTNTAAEHHRAFPWMGNYILNHDSQARMTQVKFCISDEDPQMRLATISNGRSNGNANCMIIHNSSSDDGWKVEDFVYVGAQDFSQTSNLISQNWTYSPSRNEFYFSNSGTRKHNFVQIISSASSGIYFEPDAQAWQYLNVPNPAESSHATVEVFDMFSNTFSHMKYLQDHHTGSFTITDHQNNQMTISIIVDATLSEPVVNNQVIGHPGSSVQTTGVSAHEKKMLANRIVEAVNNGGPEGTGDYFLTASLYETGVAIIQSTVSSSATNLSIDDQVVGNLLSTDIRFSNAAERDNSDISTFYPVGQAKMIGGSVGPKLSGRGGFRPARMLDNEEVSDPNTWPAIYYTGSVTPTSPNEARTYKPINRYFTIDENGELSDYHDSVYNNGVQNYLVEFGESMTLGSDRIDLIQLQRTGVLGETTDSPEGPEWLRMWENSTSNFFTEQDIDDPATQYDRYHAFWNKSEAPWVENFGKLMKIDSFGRLYVLGAGKKQIPYTNGVHDGNPDGNTLSLQNRVYVLNRDENNPKAGSSGWYVEHVFFDPDYQPGGALAGEDGYYFDKIKNEFSDFSKLKYFYGGFGAQIAVNEFAEENTTQVFISAPMRVSDEITGITHNDLNATMPFRHNSTTQRLSVEEYYWAEPAGVGYLYQSTSLGGWKFTQRFDNPVKKFLSRVDKPYNQTISRFPQMQWKNFGGDVNDYQNRQFLSTNNSPFQKYFVALDGDWSGFGNSHQSYTHAFSGSVLSLSWVDEYRDPHSWPFDRTLADAPFGSWTSAFGGLNSNVTYEAMIAAASGSESSKGSIVIYDGNAQYQTTTTTTTTRTVNIVDGPVPTRVGNVRGAFNIRGQEGTGSYRVSIGDKKK